MQLSISQTKGRLAMTIKFFNTNDKFGMEGPFEADNEKELCEELEDMFLDMARKDLTEKYEWENDEIDGQMLKEAVESLQAEFTEGLQKAWCGKPRIIFDNGGCITLQLPGFAHVYDSAEQCADDIREWLDSKNTSDWDGDEGDAVFEPSYNDIQNNGYYIVDIEDIEEINGDWGYNAASLKDALGFTMPTSLEGLQSAMENNEPCILDHHDQWSANLPTFGGEAPKDTTGIWSWDETRLLIGTCADDLEIVDR